MYAWHKITIFILQIEHDMQWYFRIQKPENQIIHIRLGREKDRERQRQEEEEMKSKTPMIHAIKYLRHFFWYTFLKIALKLLNDKY